MPGGMSVASADLTGVQMPVTKGETMEAENIRTLRHNLGMTQEEFAHRLGITVATVNRWENGHNSPTRLARKALGDLASQRVHPGQQLNNSIEG